MPEKDKTDEKNKFVPVLVEKTLIENTTTKYTHLFLTLEEYA